MSLIEILIDYFSNDFSSLNSESHSHLSSILSSLQSLDESEVIENYDDIVIEHIYLPENQPNTSQLIQTISNQLQFNFVQLCVDFYTIKNNNEDNKQLSEKSFEQLENILWKLNTHPNKSELMDSNTWSQLRPHDIYVQHRNTKQMVIKTKAPLTSMPQKPCSVQFLIDRVNKLINLNKEHIQQIRTKRAEQEAQLQEALEQEAQSLNIETEPEWDYNAGATALHEIEMVPEQESAVEQEPAVEEESAVEQEPAVEEEPSAEEEPAVEEPAVEEEPSAEEEPAVEEPAVEEEPVPEE